VVKIGSCLLDASLLEPRLLKIFSSRPLELLASTAKIFYIMLFCITLSILVVAKSSPWGNKVVPNTPAMAKMIEGIPELLFHGKATSTIRAYALAAKRYIRWCRMYDFVPFPYNEFIVSLYFMSLHNSGSNVRRAGVCLNYWFNLCGDKDAIHKGLSSEIAKSSSNLRPLRNMPKAAISEDQLQLICNYYARFSDTHMLRDLVFCIVAFHGFFRSMELLTLKWQNVTVETNFLKITVGRSKCNKKPADVMVGASGSQYCPVNVFSRYKETLSIFRPKAEDYVFPRFQRFYKSKELRPNFRHHISYSSMLTSFKSALDSIGLDSSRFGLHSFRRGGTTAAIRHGVAPRLVQRHGRWKSAACRDRYIEDSTDDLLSVSSVLNTSK
jgi:integrase